MPDRIVYRRGHGRQPVTPGHGDRLMGIPKAAISPNTHSTGVSTRLVVVQSFTADGLTAICTDKSGYEVRVPVLYQRAKGQLPAVGEQWIISQDVLPSWSFLMFMAASAADYQIPASALQADTWQSLAGLQQHGWSIITDLPVSGYRKTTAEPSVMEFMAAWNCPAANHADGTVICSLPAPYATTVTGRLTAGVIGSTAPRTDGASPFIEFEVGGDIKCYGLPVPASGGMPVYVNGRVRLS